jgi:hypothetical protein
MHPALGPASSNKKYESHLDGMRIDAARKSRCCPALQDTISAARGVSQLSVVATASNGRFFDCWLKNSVRVKTQLFSVCLMLGQVFLQANNMRQENISARNLHYK